MKYRFSNRKQVEWFLKKTFSENGIFVNYATGTLLTDPVIIVDENSLDEEVTIFSGQNLAALFEKTKTKIERRKEITNILTGLQKDKNRIEKSTNITEEIEKEYDLITITMSNLEEEEMHLNLELTIVDQSIELRSGEAKCPISGKLLKKTSIKNADFFALCCAVLLQQQLAEKSLSENLHLEMQQIFLKQFATRPKDLAMAKEVISKILLGEETGVGFEILHPCLARKLIQLIEKSIASPAEDEVLSIPVLSQLDPEVPNILPRVVVKSSNSRSYREVLTGQKDPRFKVENLNKELLVGKLYKNNLPYTMLYTKEIGTVSNNSEMLPAVPLVLPYSAKEKITRFENTSFPLAVQVCLENLQELPPEIRAFFNRLNLDPFKHGAKVNCFVVMQFTDHEKHIERLMPIFRPQPWLHQQTELDKKCIISIAEIGRKSLPPAAIEVISSDYEFEGHYLQIVGLEHKNTTGFYSIILEQDASGGFTQVTITLHCMLNRADHEVIKNIIEQNQISKVYSNDLFRLLDRSAMQNNSVVMAVKSFVAAHWESSASAQDSKIFLVEQSTSTHRALFNRDELEEIISNKESAMFDLSNNQQDTYELLQQKYNTEFRSAGGADAIIANFKRVLQEKFKQQYPGRYLILDLEGEDDVAKQFANYNLIKSLQKNKKDKLIEYLNSPYHMVLRWLSARNYFIARDAEYQATETIWISKTRKQQRAFRSIISESDLNKLAYYWLAVSDENAYTPSMKVAERIEYFITVLSALTRAHNHDSSGLDQPTCARGVGLRMCTAFVEHPILEQRKLNILENIRARFDEFVIEIFGNFLHGYRTTQLLDLYKIASNCWSNATLLEDDDTWEDFFNHWGIINDSILRQDAKNFITGLQCFLSEKLNNFEEESIAKYGNRYFVEAPSIVEITACIEFGVSPAAQRKVIYGSYKQFIDHLIRLFWSNNKNNKEVILNKAMGRFLERFEGIVNARIRNIQKVQELSKSGSPIIFGMYGRRNNGFVDITKSPERLDLKSPDEYSEEDEEIIRLMPAVTPMRI